MIVIGLTGSIAMGKTTVAAQFAALGASVISADAIVHALLSEGGAAVHEVGKLFPEAKNGNAIDRKALGKAVFNDIEKLIALEQLLHPMVVQEEEHFVRQCRESGARCVVLDIPLLFETGAETRVDKTVVVTAPAFIQRYRVKRRGLTMERFRAILARQMPDAQKRSKADFVVQTGLGKAYSFLQVKKIMETLCAK